MSLDARGMSKDPNKNEALLGDEDSVIVGNLLKQAFDAFESR
jgi:hypothetical protein